MRVGVLVTVLASPSWYAPFQYQPAGRHWALKPRHWAKFGGMGVGGEVVAHHSNQSVPCRRPMPWPRPLLHQSWLRMEASAGRRMAARATETLQRARRRRLVGCAAVIPGCSVGAIAGCGVGAARLGVPGA